MNGIFEYDQAKALANLGHKIIYAVIDMRSIRRWRKWGIEKFERDGVQVYAINYPLGRIPKWMMNIFSSHALRTLYKKIERESGRPDIMHAHFTGSGYAAAKLKEDTDIPLVLTEHSSGLMASDLDISNMDREKYVYRSSDGIITVSPDLQEVLKNRFETDSIYIPNIIDTDSFAYEPERDDSEAFSFITVGNLIYRKRMDLTIEAFAQAFPNDDRTKLIIIGEGPERGKLETLIADYELRDRVTMTGSLNRREISDYMNRSNCFVLPSRAETFGVVYIEAMATGLPAIATHCGGPEVIVDDSNGIMIDVDNLGQLVDAMIYMREHVDEYDAEAIVADTLAKYSPEAVAEQIVGIYEEILKYQKSEEEKYGNKE